MTTKVIITREIKEGQKDKALELIRKLRAGAMSQPGYISGETLVSNRNPNRIVVISTWSNIGNWLDWTENPNRNILEKELSEYLVTPSHYEDFTLGAE